MPIKIFSQKGTCTADNRDVVTHTFSACGTIGLFIVLDGATSCPSSGEFSRDLAEFITAEFHTLATSELSDEHGVLSILKSAQIALQHKYLCDFSSLLLVVVNSCEPLLVIHAGDCCLGVIDAAHNIEWITRVHTAANAISSASVDNIKNDPKRHLLTKSFKAKKYVMPDIQYIALPRATKIIMATDGFWALTAAEQQQIITQSPTQFELEDDASFIIFNSEQ
jgi:PPM family protein phosphatase